MNTDNGYRSYNWYTFWITKASARFDHKEALPMARILQASNMDALPSTPLNLSAKVKTHAMERLDRCRQSFIANRHLTSESCSLPNRVGKFRKPLSMKLGRHSFCATAAQRAPHSRFAVLAISGP